jgi:hypothetical protein
VPLSEEFVDLRLSAIFEDFAEFLELLEGNLIAHIRPELAQVVRADRCVGRGWTARVLRQVFDPLTAGDTLFSARKRRRRSG